MIKKIFIVYFLIAIFSSCSHEEKIVNNSTLSGQITNYTGAVYLDRIVYGVQCPFVKLYADKLGNFFYNVPDTLSTGEYILHWDKSGEKKIHLILGDESIHFTTSNHLLPKVKFHDSPINQAFNDYLSYREDFFSKFDLLSFNLERYPLEDPFYKEIENQFIFLQKQYYTLSNKLIRTYPNTFLENLVTYDELPKVYPVPDYIDVKKQLFEHWLKTLDFKNESLLYTQFLQKKVREYLILSQSICKTEMEKYNNLLYSLKNLLNQSYNNSQLFDCMVSYLLEQFSYDAKIISTVLQSYNEKYQSESQCTLKSKQILPEDFNPNQLTEIIHKTTKTNKEYTLLLFNLNHTEKNTELLHSILSFSTPHLKKKFDIICVDKGNLQPESILSDWTVVESRDLIDSFNILSDAYYVLLDKNLNPILTNVHIYGLLSYFYSMRIFNQDENYQ